MNPETWLSLAAAVLALAALPGPSALLIAAQARALGLAAALAALSGDLLACALLVAVVGAGLGEALAAAPGLLGALRWIGFGWLAWILLRAILARGDGAAPVRRAPPAALFAQGFLTCAANPKLILHLAAFMPLFLDPGRPLAPQVAIVALTHVVFDGLALGGWAVAAARIGRGPRAARQSKHGASASASARNAPAACCAAEA